LKEDAMGNGKHPTPARVRPKVGNKKNRNALLATGQQYVSGQATADPQNKLQQQAQAVAGTRTSLVALLAKRSDLKAQLDTTQGAIVIADAQYGQALTTYAGAAATLAAGDASLLASLGVASAAPPTKSADAVIDTPVLKVGQGPAQGDAELRCKAVPHAGSYLFQYKLEPSQPTDPWLGNIATKIVSTIVHGLPPAQLIRGRVQAIGVAPGPWSVEVVGRAK
jgi:hypothetical protein